MHTTNPKKGYDTVSRETSAGPSVFTSGLVKIGVGLSHNQFGSRMESNTWKDLVRALGWLVVACPVSIDFDRRLDRSILRSESASD